MQMWLPSKLLVRDKACVATGRRPKPVLLHSRSQLQSRLQQQRTACLTVTCFQNSSGIVTLPERSKNALDNADIAWKKLCSGPGQPFKTVVHQEQSLGLPHTPDVRLVDVVVLGGTLGLPVALALQKQGFTVAIIERNAVKGREQEWNLCAQDMDIFVRLGMLTPSEIEEVIVSRFERCSVRIKDGATLDASGAYDCGVSPRHLVRKLLDSFRSAGGVVIEGASFKRATVYANGVQVDYTQADQSRVDARAGGAGGDGMQLQINAGGKAAEQPAAIQARLVIDAMGSFSPISAQARAGRKPDTAVVMVGSCATGVPTAADDDGCADLLSSIAPIDKQLGVQLFWERFPAHDGVTTYAFCYTDPVPGRMSLKQLWQAYMQQLPTYLNVDAADLMSSIDLRRTFFGFVPCYADAAPPMVADRVVPFGDAAGSSMRSALSFAGFAAMTRHLERYVDGVSEALSANALSRAELSMLCPVMPSTALTLAMQRAMGTFAGQNIEHCDPHIINRFLASSMETLQGISKRHSTGDHGAQHGLARQHDVAEAGRKQASVLEMFMRDVFTWPLMSALVGKQFAANPRLQIDMALFLGPSGAGQMFARHLTGLWWYNIMHAAGAYCDSFHRAMLQQWPRLLYRWNRARDAWKFGSANDFFDHH